MYKQAIAEQSAIICYMYDSDMLQSLGEAGLCKCNKGEMQYYCLTQCIASLVNGSTIMSDNVKLTIRYSNCLTKEN